MKRKALIIKIAVLVSAACVAAAPMAAFADVDNGVAYHETGGGSTDAVGESFSGDAGADSVSERTIIAPDDESLGLPGPGEDNEALSRPDGMDEGTWDKLQDSVIEWYEIGNLIEYYNPTYVKYAEQANNTSLDEMKGAYETFVSAMAETAAEVDETISMLKSSYREMQSVSDETVEYDGTTMSKQEALAKLDDAIESAVSGRNQALSAVGSTKRSLLSGSDAVDRGLKSAREQIEAQIRQLVIQYGTLKSQRKLVEQQIVLYETLLSTQQQMLNNELATAAEVAAYKNSLDSAKASLSQIDAGMEQLKDSIGIQCGYGSGDFTIADLPAPDRNFMDGRNYEEDKKSAIQNNSTVQDAGKLSEYEYSSYGDELRQLGENEAAGKASAKMDSIKNELEAEIVLNDSADSTERKAELALNSAETKKRLGMLGNAEYEAQKLTCYSYTASVELSRLNLHQAIENYRWAVEGIMSID